MVIAHENVKIILLHGNGNSTPQDNWLPYVKHEFEKYEKLGSEYYEFNDQGHFGGDYYKKEFPELVAAVKRKLK